MSWTSVGNALRSHPASIGTGHRHPDCDSSFLPRPCCCGWVAASSVSSEGVSSTEQAKGDETRRDKTEMQRQRRSSGVDLCWIRTNVNIASHPCLEWNWAAASRSNMDEILMSCRSRDLELGRKGSIPRFRGFMPACQPAQILPFP